MIETNAAPSASFPCRNCAAAMDAEQRFCDACGQRAVAGRLTMRDIAHDLVHAITHADHSIFSLLKALTLHPGRVAREYIEGKRKKYFGPFAFLIISVGLTSFIILVAGTSWFSPIEDNRVSNFLQRHINLVILMQVPILALLCWGLFFRARLHYAEHLILGAYTSGFRALFLGLVETPLLYLAGATKAEPRFVWAYFAIWVAYFAFAATHFYRGRAWTAVKAIVVAILSQLAAIYVIFVYVYLYARFAN